MKIDVVMTEAIFRRFAVFDLLHHRKMWKSPAIFASILSAAAIVCFIMQHVRGAVFLGTTLLTIGLGVPVLSFVNFFLSLNSQVTKMGLKRPQNVYTLVLTKKPEGIHISNEKEQADYAWKNVFRVYRDTTAVYLYMTPTRAFLLPNTSLEDIEQEDLWQLITEMVAKDKCVAR